MVDAADALPLPWLAAPLAAARAQPGHALLVVGAPGMGAFELLTTLAQAWLCEAVPARPRACGVCAGCRLVRAGTHPDLRLLMPESLRVARGDAGADAGDEGGEGGSGSGGGKRKPSRQIRISDVREGIDWVVKTSSRGGTKVLLLHPAEALNQQSASALLKTLEEPPPNVRLVLSCTDPERLLPTVRSRCQRIVLAPPSLADALRWLQGQGLAESDATVLLAAAAGQPLEALALAQAGVDAAAWTALPPALRDGRSAAWVGWPVARAVDALLKLCHDLMAVAVGAAPRYFPPSSVPAGADLVALDAWAQTLAQTARQAEHPWNEALLLDALVSQGRRALATLAR
ncbi:MAG: DNA polymerase III subunit delta' [Rubrivivax sp.]